MKEFWEQLNERERGLLIVALACVCLYVFYAWIYSPLSDLVDAQWAQYQDKQRTLSWMQDASQRARSMPSHAPQKLSSHQLLSTLSSQLKTSSLSQFPFQLQQTSTNDIDLSFEAVPYLLLLNWLSSFQKNYMVSIQQAIIEPTPTPGVVKVRLLINGPQ